MRNAARSKTYRGAFPFEIRPVQAVVDTQVDGEWGPKSQAALKKWVAGFQGLVGVARDGEWGPRTDNAYLAFRRANFRK